jgi:pSer/pThr/pTyr-binding forkhead associated (FHA) protein
VSLLPGLFEDKDYRRYSAPQERPVRASVVRVLVNGSDGEMYAIRAFPFVLGREEGDVRCGGDRFMSRRHAAVVETPRGLALQDQKSRNGTFVRAGKKVALGNGDVFMVGRQLFRFEAVSQ